MANACQVCGSWPRASVCAECTQAFAMPLPRCTRCAIALGAAWRQEQNTPALCCAACLRQAPPLARTWAAVDYAYPWNGLIAQLKHRQQPGLAPHLATLWMGIDGPSELLRQGARVLAVPSSAARLSERGYNHAALLARAWCRAHAANAALAPSQWLLRPLDDAQQQASTRAQRLRQMRHAFVVPPEQVAQVRGQQLLLVDDVMTTGATLHAAALALLQAGAAQVSALVLARTPED